MASAEPGGRGKTVEQNRLKIAKGKKKYFLSLQTSKEIKLLCLFYCSFAKHPRS